MLFEELLHIGVRIGEMIGIECIAVQSLMEQFAVGDCPCLEFIHAGIRRDAFVALFVDRLPRLGKVAVAIAVVTDVQRVSPS